MNVNNLARHWPYRAAIMCPNDQRVVWWPESSYESDTMVIGDRIPGDQKTAELCARCCNIAYRHALDDIQALFKQHGMDASALIMELVKLETNPLQTV